MSITHDSWGEWRVRVRGWAVGGRTINYVLQTGSWSTEHSLQLVITRPIKVNILRLGVFWRIEGEKVSDASRFSLVIRHETGLSLIGHRSWGPVTHAGVSSAHPCNLSWYSGPLSASDSWLGLMHFVNKAYLMQTLYNHSLVSITQTSWNFTVWWL